MQPVCRAVFPLPVTVVDIHECSADVHNPLHVDLSWAGSLVWPMAPVCVYINGQHESVCTNDAKQKLVRERS